MFYECVLLICDDIIRFMMLWQVFDEYELFHVKYIWYMINIYVAQGLKRKVNWLTAQVPARCLREMDYLERRLKSVREPPLGSTLPYMLPAILGS